MRILFTEDDAIGADYSQVGQPNLIDDLITLLNAAGISADRVPVADAVDMVRRPNIYDAVILDSRFADITDFALARTRNRHMWQAAGKSGTPLLILFDDAPHDADKRKVVANILKLASRRKKGYRTVPSLTARAPEPTGALQFDIGARAIQANGNRIDLTLTEGAILAWLAANKGATLTTEIFALLRDEAMVGRHMKPFVCTLRGKLDKIGVTHFIRSMAGPGYLMPINAKIEVLGRMRPPPEAPPIKPLPTHPIAKQNRHAAA